MKKIFLILITFFMFTNIKALELNSKYVYVYNDTLDRVMYELNSNEEIVLIKNDKNENLAVYQKYKNGLYKSLRGL